MKQFSDPVEQEPLKRVHRVWTSLLWFMTLSFTAVTIAFIALRKVLSINDQHHDNDRELTYVYLATTFLPLSSIILCFQITYHTPPPKTTTTTLLGIIWQHAPLINHLIAISAVTVLRYFTKAYRTVFIQTLLVPYTLLMYHRGLKLTRSLRYERLKNDTKALNTLNLSMLPRLVVSTMVSYLYVSR